MLVAMEVTANNSRVSCNMVEVDPKHFQQNFHNGKSFVNSEADCF